MESISPRSTIGLRRSTKAKLDQSRAPGQCYDGFLCQLVDMWEEVHGKQQPVGLHSGGMQYQSIRKTGKGGGI